jgi:hypothetical protein
MKMDDVSWNKFRSSLERMVDIIGPIVIYVEHVNTKPKDVLDDPLKCFRVLPSLEKIANCQMVAVIPSCEKVHIIKDRFETRRSEKDKLCIL